MAVRHGRRTAEAAAELNARIGTGTVQRIRAEMAA
jgi:hypothetical protein